MTRSNAGEKIPPTTDEWGKRADVVFRDTSWQFHTVDELQEAQKNRSQSIGVVIPRKVIAIDVVDREESEIHSFHEKFHELKRKLEAKRAQLTLFEQSVPPEMKHLEFLKARIQVQWLCKNDACRGHKMQILDWEVCELQRRVGDEDTLNKLHEIVDLSRTDLRFFLGNLFLHPNIFMIVGLWYPKRANLLFR